jgi:hypothetical protein
MAERLPPTSQNRFRQFVNCFNANDGLLPGKNEQNGSAADALLANEQCSIKVFPE